MLQSTNDLKTNFSEGISLKEGVKSFSFCWQAKMATKLAEALLARDRAALSRAITLAESRAPRHREAINTMLNALLPRRAGLRSSLRIGISGPPGAGKSTLIEALGNELLSRGNALAVLAIDPSSSRSGGSILGDKTRMPTLAADRRAFVRPSPTRGALGGVARRTEDAILLCECAGYDRVIVETVGVGQSEVAVAGMVDVFVLLVVSPLWTRVKSQGASSPYLGHVRDLS
jgi:LAO/AO transport system kinase